MNIPAVQRNEMIFHSDIKFTDFEREVLAQKCQVYYYDDLQKLHCEDSEELLKKYITEAKEVLAIEEENMKNSESS